MIDERSGDSDSFVHLGLRGEIYRQQGKSDQALADFNIAISRFAEYPLARVGRGQIYQARGDVARAREDFRVASTWEIDESDEQDVALRSRAKALLAALEDQPIIVTPPPTPTPEIIPTPKIVKPLGRRVALVIGNTSYKHVPSLPNPVRDADMMAKAFRSAGFEVVTTSNDLTRDRLVATLKAFANEADKSDWAVIYFAGHGIEIGGVNYLVPTDAKLAVDRDVQFEAISLDQVMASVQGAKRLRVVLLDACRDNPFVSQMRRTVATRSISRGLGQIEPDVGTLVFYAAKHGNYALDGAGQNSPFAAALAKRMLQPNVEITKLFRQVRDEVLEITKRQQEPFTYGSLPGSEDFYFVSK